MTIGEFRAFVSGMALSIKDAPDADQWAAIEAALATVTICPVLPLSNHGLVPRWPYEFGATPHSGRPMPILTYTT